MTILTRTDAIRDIARWWLEKFEQDWCINGQPEYKLTKEANVRLIQKRAWLKAKTTCIINHDRFMAVDDAGWYNRLDVQSGRSPRISKVIDG